MKTKKILRAAIVFILIAAFLTGTVSAAAYTPGADDLKDLGLFLGTENGYELDRSPTRAEAAVMLVRLLGKETEVKENSYEHPFKDVPDWVDSYVGYLYENDLTNGISADKFGASDLCNAQMFCAFVLRALGYTEDDGDFEYADAIDFANEFGLINDDIWYYMGEVELYMGEDNFAWYYENYARMWSYWKGDAFPEWYDEDEDADYYVGYLEYLDSIFGDAEDYDEWFDEWYAGTAEATELYYNEMRELYSFKRDHCVSIMYNALNTNIKGEEITLLDKLVEENAVDADAAAKFKEKNSLVDELNKLFKSSLIATMAAAMEQPFSMQFEIISSAPALEVELEDILAWYEEQGITYEEVEAMLDSLGYGFEDLTAASETKIAFVITVVGEEFALEGKISGSGLSSLGGLLGMNIDTDGDLDFAVYYTDGYIYYDFMGEKVQQKVDYGEEEIGDIISEIDLSDYFDELSINILPSKIGGIEKILTDKNVTYTINMSDDSLGIPIEESLSMAFTLNGEIDSIGLYMKLSYGDMLADIAPFYENYYTEIQIGVKIIIGDDITINFPDFSDYVNKYELAEELNALLKSSVISDADTPYSFDFEMIYESDGWRQETKGSISVIGSDYAADFTFIYDDDSVTNISQYFKDGYFYINEDGEKTKQELELDYAFNISHILPSYLFIGFGDFEIPSYAMGSMTIEKIISDETITFKIAPQSYYYGYSSYYTEAEMILTFNLDGELLSIYVEVKDFWDGELYYYEKVDITITATGDDVTIDFPDFSDYVEVEAQG